MNDNLVRIDAARINHRLEHRLIKEPDIKLDPYWANALLSVPFEPRKYLNSYFEFSFTNLLLTFSFQHHPKVKVPLCTRPNHQPRFQLRSSLEEENLQSTHSTILLKLHKHIVMLVVKEMQELAMLDLVQVLA